MLIISGPFYFINNLNYTAITKVMLVQLDHWVHLENLVLLVRLVLLDQLVR